MQLDQKAKKKNQKVRANHLGVDDHYNINLGLDSLLNLALKI